jgi:hypothetical protein
VAETAKKKRALDEVSPPLHQLGLHHTIAVSLDRLTQQPVVDHRVAPAPEGFIKTGRKIAVH